MLAQRSQVLRDIGEQLRERFGEISHAVAGVYAARGLDGEFQSRATAILEGCVLEMSRGGRALLDEGESFGLDTLNWFEDRNARYAEVANLLQEIRNDVYFSVVPSYLEPDLREPAMRGFATFLTGYVRKINLGNSALAYHTIGLNVRQLATAQSPEAMVRIALEAAITLVRLDDAWFFRREDAWKTVAHVGSAEREPVLDDGAFDGIDAPLSGEAVDLSDGRAAPLARALGVTSGLVVPVMVEGDWWGALVLSRRGESPFDVQERAIVDIVGAQLTANVRKELVSRRLRATLEALKASETRLRTELRRKTEIANALQQAFIPKSFPVVRGIGFDALYVPAEDDARIGGDWYDAFALPDGTIGFSIGDVAGHGLEAAVTMGAIRQGVYAAALESPDPARVLERVNRVAFLQRSVMVTAIVGFIDPASNVLTFASAGHPPPLYARPEGVEFLEIGGVPLGVLEHVEPRVHVKRFERPSFFVFYTDGLIEATRNVAAGQERLVSSARLHAARSRWSDAAQSIYDEALGEQRSSDDVAVLVIRAHADGERGEVSSTRDASGAVAWDFDSSDVFAARTVREDVRDRLIALGFGAEALANAELIAGELLANVVEYAPGPVHVVLDCTAETPTLTVDDAGPGFTFRPHLPEPMSEGGRGLFLVSQVARELRVRHRLEGGTEVCAVLPLD